MADDSVIFIASTKAPLEVRHCHSGKRALQFMGTISEESIRAWNTHHNFGAVSELVLEPAGIVRDVTLGDRDVMLLLSSEAPVEVHNIKAGPESVLFLGHMSSTAISIVLGMFDLKFTPNDTGVYKVVFQPEHSKLLFPLILA
jgi:hypothetical protein